MYVHICLFEDIHIRVYSCHILCLEIKMYIKQFLTLNNYICTNCLSLQVAPKRSYWITAPVWSKHRKCWRGLSKQCTSSNSSVSKSMIPWESWDGSWLAERGKHPVPRHAVIGHFRHHCWCCVTLIQDSLFSLWTCGCHWRVGKRGRRPRWHGGSWRNTCRSQSASRSCWRSHHPHSGT